MQGAIRLYRNLEEAGEGFGPCALTIGNFDGVHAGHREIMRRVVSMARKNGWKPSVLTFDPHPAKVVAPERAPKLLTSPEERAALMAEEGIEQVLILPFDAAFSQMGGDEFVERIVVGKLGARAVLVGDNFHFGKGQAGHTDRLQELGRQLGFETEILRPIWRRGRMVSSSEVRKLVREGKVSLAARLLERPIVLRGVVVTGRGVGSKQTVPTLNLKTDAEVLPATGVYITGTTDLVSGRRWPSITNIGYRPTFGGEDLSIETFLLAPLVGDTPTEIQVKFCRRVRDERKFESPEALKSQILKDVGRAKVWFRRLDSRVRNEAPVR